MPQKPSSWGIQEYIPAGNGDPSGEYADNQGNNVHFSVFANPLPKSFSTMKTTPTPKSKPKAPKQKAPAQKADTLTQKVDAVLKNDKIKTGSDILGTYKKKPGKGIGIKQAMKEQGFDGLPQVVDADVFDEVVKKSSFIAQRAVRAYSQAEKDKYQNQLYNGDWYVDCSNGGAQYGQGMYCAADYTGNLTSGIKTEVAGYTMGSSFATIETFTLAPDAKIVKHQDIIKELKNRMDSDGKVYDVIHKKLADVVAKEIGSSSLASVKKQDQALYDYINHQVEYKLTGDVKRNAKLPKQRTANLSTMENRARIAVDNLSVQFANAVNPKSYSNYAQDMMVSRMCQKLGFNDGELATVMGYDAINAEGHGASGSYTVILNRTKTIFKKQ